MNEQSQIVGAVLALIPSVVFALFSAEGGRDYDWMNISARIWKRCIAPISFVSITLVLSLISGKYSHWFLLCYLTYFLNMVGYGSKGYGTWFKILRRVIWSLIRVASCLPIVLAMGTSQVYILFALQAVICLSVTVALGVWNPLKAPVEEFLINLLSLLIVPFMVIF